MGVAEALAVMKREQETRVLEKRSQHDCSEEAYYWMVEKVEVESLAAPELSCLPEETS